MALYSVVSCLTGSIKKISPDSRDWWVALHAATEKVTLPAGQIVDREMAPFPGIACVRSGSLQRRIQNGDSQFVMAQLMVESDLLGLECLIDEGHCQDQFRTREKTVLYYFPQELVKDLVLKVPTVAHHLFQVQSEYTRELLTHVQVLSNKSLQARTAAGILYFCGKLGPRPWTNRELALWAGVTQEGVGRSFSNLMSQGVIKKIKRQTIIRDTMTLQKMASDFKEQTAPFLTSYLVRQ